MRLIGRLGGASLATSSFNTMKMIDLPRGVLILVVGWSFLSLLPGARAHGDPVSEVLIAQGVFLPFQASVDSAATRRLYAVVRDADGAGFQIKAAVIAEPADLGPRFGLYGDPQGCAEFLAADLSARVLVVMPNGLGYAVNGKPAPRFSRALKGLAGPGRDVTKQAQAATVAIRRLALAGGHTIVVSKSGGSNARDRITIAAAAVAGVALIAGLLLFRRQRRARPE